MRANSRPGETYPYDLSAQSCFLSKADFSWSRRRVVLQFLIFVDLLVLLDICRGFLTKLNIDKLPESTSQHGNYCVTQLMINESGLHIFLDYEIWLIKVFKFLFKILYIIFLKNLCFNFKHLATSWMVTSKYKVSDLALTLRPSIQRFFRPKLT